MTNKKILIVGSGPSVYGSLLAMKNFENVDVIIIDNSEIQSIEENDMCIFDNQFKNGNRISTDDIFEKEYIELLKDNANISKSFGGFSNVWGGTFDIPTLKTNKILSELGIDLNKSLEIVEKNIPSFVAEDSYDYFTKRLIKKGLNIKNSKIAINNEVLSSFDNKKLCKYCGSYKWSCKKNSIWSSKKAIKGFLKNESLTYIPNAKLIRFMENNSVVNCEILIDGETKTYFFDKIFIGCGPVGTSIIYLNSNYVNRVKFKSSDLIQVPFFKVKKTRVKNTSFSDFFAYDENNNYYLQFYFYSKSVLKLAKSITKFTFNDKILPQRFLNFFGGVFIYINEELSSSFEIYKDDGVLKLNNFESKKSNSELKKNIFKILRSSGIYVIYFFKNELRYGKSYHYGSQFPHAIEATKNTTDTQGRLNNLKNTHIIDASVLPSVNTGPVTKTIIANSYRITNEVLKNLES